eukprot:UN05017
MLFYLLLIVPAVFAQTYQVSIIGVCWNIDKTASPPNYSKNGVGASSCRTYCSNEDLCVGYSHAQQLNNRCAIWIDRNVINASDKFPATEGWAFHNYQEGWIENVTKLDGGDYVHPQDANTDKAKWACYIRNDTCPAGAMTIGAATVSYPELDQGAYFDQDCPPGTTGGPLRVECRSGTTVKVDLPNSTNSCALEIVIEFTDMGVGVCRDHTITNTGTGIGPGVSPPNYSKQPVANLETCKQECRDESLLCNGIGWNEGQKRCALFINTDTQYCGSKRGWETHAYQYGWTPAAEIDGTSGEAGWKCHKRATTGQLINSFEQQDGTGVCVNSYDGSPANYSKGGTSSNICANECAGRSDCLGFSHNLADMRCALWMNTMTNLPGLTGWEAHVGEPQWDLQKEITKADGEGSGWLCYKKNGRRKQ